MRDDQWLASLKVGDEVTIVGFHNEKTICKIDRITPTGMIGIGGTRFKEGVEWTSDWNKSHLDKVTPEIVLEIEHTQLIERISHQNWYKKYLTIDQLRRIDAILKEGKI